jgi:cytochrome c biogenesis protein CcmG/thiol:disulfide interchange protein DsbE
VKRLLFLVPVLVFAGIAALLFSSYRSAQPGSGNLVDSPLPFDAFPAFGAGVPGFDVQDLRAGHVTVLNIWASWCVQCRIEAPQLARLSKQKGFQLYGVAYRDEAGKARAFLAEIGQPFSRIDIDASGRIAKLWNVEGAPQTFVLDGHGILRARIVGPVTAAILQDRVLPATAEAEAE